MNTKHDVSKLSPEGRIARLESVLRPLVKEHGRDILKEEKGKRILGFTMDGDPENKTALLFVRLVCCETKIIEDLLGKEGGSDHTQFRVYGKLTEDHGMNPVVAAEGIRVLCVVIGHTFDSRIMERARGYFGKGTPVSPSVSSSRSTSISCNAVDY